MNAADPATFLRAELRREPRLEKRLLKRAARAGIQPSKLKSVAAEIGVEIIGHGTGLAFWMLPVKRT